MVDRSLLESKSDFYALGSGLAYLPEAFATADARARGVRHAFVFALTYNFAVVSLSATAGMSPLLAAVLMPLSSIISILLAAAGSRTSRIAIPDTKPYGRNLISKPFPKLHEPGEQAI